jgi:hypothetical protein
MPGQLRNSIATAFPLTLFLLLAQATGGFASARPAGAPGPASSPELSVVCDPRDSLRPVAEEIAREAGARVSDSWPIPDGAYAVWVVEPGRLSDRAVTGFARLWRDRFPGTAVGVITGRSPEQCLALWRRAGEARGVPSGAFVQRKGVKRGAFLEALRLGGYVTFAGHAGPSFLQLSDSVLRSRDLPPLPGVVVGTESCNVFRPWERESIALAFAEGGAAAFAFLGGLVALLAASAVKPGGRKLAAGVIAGGAMASLHALWVVGRLGHVTITSKPVGFSWPAVVATFILMSAASTVYLGARKRSGRIFAIVLAASLVWLPEALYAGYKASANLTVFQPGVGASMYNHNTAILSGCSTAIVCLSLLGILMPLRRLVK